MMILANIDDTLPIKLFLVITSLIFYLMFCLQLFIGLFSPIYFGYCLSLHLRLLIIPLLSLYLFFISFLNTFNTFAQITCFVMLALYINKMFTSLFKYC
jgi:hypothetical protein